MILKYLALNLRFIVNVRSDLTSLESTMLVYKEREKGCLKLNSIDNMVRVNVKYPFGLNYGF
jgi:hypothetical protein